MTTQEFLAKFPQIGVLTRNGKTIYYVTSPFYREAHHPLELIDNL